MRDRR